MSGFEAKKAFIFELEAHDHGGLEEEDGDEEEMWGHGIRNLGAKKEGKVSLLLKVVWLLE